MTGPMIARPGGALTGEAAAPGDKSISHRALLFGALAPETSIIRGLLEGEDVLRTASALRALGADIEREHDEWRVTGGQWSSPDQRLYLGNSGTGARLLMGAVAGRGIAASFDGDASLRSRPMSRVLEPLRLMGAEAESEAGRLPVRLRGGGALRAIACKLSKPSAQVKSAILLAALGAEGATRIHEPLLCRDHTERMLAAFGVDLGYEPDGEGGRHILMEGAQALRSTDVLVPGDPSSAAFLVAAALIAPRSDILVRNVLVNPLRAGFYETLREMGADIAFENRREAGGEPIADIRARSSVLEGVRTPAERAPAMIDEYPILAIVAAFAHGETRMEGLAELRVKESDRLSAIERGLVACGADVRSGEDWLRVRGDGRALAGGVRVRTDHDHRIAMSFLVAGLGAAAPIEIDDAAMIATSFPNFYALMTGLGAELEPAPAR